MGFKTIFFVFLTIVFVSCNENNRFRYIEDRGEIFHTSYSIKYEYSRSLQSEIEIELAKFDDSLNPFKSNSIISKVNKNEEVMLDSFFVNVFNRSQQISKISDGLFDITMSPLINAWGFGFSNIDDVTPQQIDSLKAITGYRKIDLRDGSIIKEDSRIQINTSGIAKGYSTDVIAALLESYGIENYMIEIGGEIRVKGVNIKGDCWRIGIDKPIEDSLAIHRELQLTLSLCDKAIATSGNYRKFYIKNGRKYAHTIDPRTGYPAENNILSATVIADDCMTADAYATVFMLADTALTREIAKKENLAYMLLLSSEKDTVDIITSSDFKKYIVSEK